MYDMEPQNREQTTALSEEGSNGSDGKRNQPSSVLAPTEAPPRDRRKKPRIRETPPTPPPPPPPDAHHPPLRRAEIDKTPLSVSASPRKTDQKGKKEEKKT